MTNRKKRMVTLTVDPDLWARMQAWIEAQALPPRQNQVVEAALKAWLDEKKEAGE